jgi:hypothetical protein
MLAKLAEYGAQQQDLLRHNSFQDAAEFRYTICAAIPSIIEMLKNKGQDVQPAGVSTLAKLAQYGTLQQDFIATRLIQLYSRVW